LSAFGIEHLCVPDDAALSAWIDPDLRRHHARPGMRSALSAAQRDLVAAIDDRSILEWTFPEETAAVFDAATAEAASRLAYG
jgi:hypothetical protein